MIEPRKRTRDHQDNERLGKALSIHTYEKYWDPLNPIPKKNEKYWDLLNPIPKKQTIEIPSQQVSTVYLDTLQIRKACRKCDQNRPTTKFHQHPLPSVLKTAAIQLVNTMQRKHFNDILMTLKVTEQKYSLLPTNRAIHNYHYELDQHGSEVYRCDASKT